MMGVLLYAVCHLPPVGPIQAVAGLVHLLCTLTSTLPFFCAIIISCRFRDATTRAKIGFDQLKDRTHSIVVPLMGKIYREMVKGEYTPCFSGQTRFQAKHGRGRRPHVPQTAVNSILMRELPAALAKHAHLLFFRARRWG